jgi:PAS domain S-box-containing protein
VGVLRPTKSALKRLVGLATATVPEVGRFARLLGELFERERGDTLRMSREFRDLVERMPQQLWVTRPDGYHEYFNQRVFEYSGLTFDGLRGARAMELIHPDELPIAMMRLGRSLQTGLPYEIEYRLRAGPRGDYRWFLGRAVPLRDEAGLITRWVGTCTDIHEVKLAEERLARELEAEQRGYRRLEQELHLGEIFTGVLGHDLRNPLTAISASAQLLQEGLPREKSAEVAGRISASAARMGRMIEQLLDLTRIRAGGGMPLRRLPMELGQVCEQAVREIEIAQRRRQFALTIVGDTSGRWDPDRLGQVVSNLVGNAARHGAAGLIETTLDGSEPDEVTFVVYNRGAIPPALIPHIFEPFHQGDGRRGGLGLGLFITKQIVEAHGGSLAVLSTPSEGTSFQVRLPRESWEEASPLSHFPGGAA